MTGFIILFVILCVIAIFFSISYYYRSTLPNKQKVIFSLLRLLIILCILVAFLEPVIKFQRLSPEKQTVPVLIDGSLSMNLFYPESSIIPLANKLLLTNKSHSDAPQFGLFLFGDSLRSISTGNNIAFNDVQSKFPDLHSKSFKNAQNMIIISDANWTENNLLSDDYTERSIYYVNLPIPKTKPFLDMTIIDSTSDNGSSLFLKITSDGYLKNSDNLEISVFEHKKRIFQKSAPVDSGYFTSTFLVQINKENSGKHLYRIVASAKKDSVYCEKFFLHFIKPQFFTYSYMNQQASLDSRFFKIALQKDSLFIENRNTTKHSDLFIFFRNETNTSTKLPSKGLLLFLGCPPSADYINQKTPEDAFLLQTENSDLFSIEQFPVKDFPPPESFFLSKYKQKRIADFLSIVHSTDKKKDTIPLLFNGTIGQQEYIALTASGFWRWDFWPLSLSKNDDRPFFFSEQLLTIIKATLLRQAESSFFFYPVSGKGSFDSLVFAFSVPSVINSYSEAIVNFSMKSTTSSFQFDTTCKINLSGLKTKFFKIKRFDPGTYIYNCNVIYNKDTFAYSDSINVLEIQSEYTVRNQNKDLLEQFAHAVRLDSDSTFNEWIEKIKKTPRVPIEDYFSITRSWLLLTVLFLLFTLEWYLRKKYDLD